MNIKAYVISLFVYMVFIITAVAGFPVAFLVWLFLFFFNGRKRIFHRMTAYWAQFYIFINPWWKLRISGSKKPDNKKTYIIVSNHQSMLDIPMLFALNTDFKWVSKIEVFRLPIVGWMMRMNRYISIRRGSLKSIARLMKDCEKALRQGNSLLFFPEGTRSKDGNMGKFKEGAFKLAMDNRIDILPVIINGTAEALPKKGIIFRKKQTITIHILDEILYTDYKGTSIGELMNSVHSLMFTGLKKIRQSE